MKLMKLLATGLITLITISANASTQGGIFVPNGDGLLMSLEDLSKWEQLNTSDLDKMCYLGDPAESLRVVSDLSKHGLLGKWGDYQDSLEFSRGTLEMDRGAQVILMTLLPPALEDPGVSVVVRECGK